MRIEINLRARKYGLPDKLKLDARRGLPDLQRVSTGTTTIPCLFPAPIPKPVAFDNDRPSLPSAAGARRLDVLSFRSAHPPPSFPLVMIILDDDVEQLPKLASPPPVHSLVRLTRLSTTSPSLPDYETSQKIQRLGTWRRRIMTRRWRWAIYGLITYFVVTLAIGLPPGHYRKLSAPFSI